MFNSIFSGKSNKSQQNINNFIDFLEYLNFKFKPYPKQVEMVEFCFQYDKRTKLVVARRKIGKSELIAIAGVLWELYKDPTKTFIIISYKQSKSMAIIKTISNYMNNSGLFNIVVDNASTLRLAQNKFSKEPTIEAMSLQTILRGVHPDMIIFDDPLTMENADSQLMRQLAKTKYEEALSLTPNVVVIGQPAHEEDLYAILREEDLASVDKMEIWNDDIPELKQDLQALRGQAMSERTIKANYEGILILDENYPFADFKTVNFTGYRPQFLFIDPAFSGKDDIGIAFLDNYNDKLYCYCQAIRGNILEEKSILEILNVIRGFDDSELQIFVESNDNGGAYAYIKTYFENNNINYDLFKVRQHGSKEIRIRDNIISVFNRLKFINPSNLLYIHRFNPNIKNQRDDVPDAVSGAVYTFNNYLKIIKENIK